MTPRTDHRYFLPRHGLAFEASWRRPARRRGGWIRDLLSGRPAGRGPEDSVSPAALLAAVDLLEEDDIQAATEAFTGLGYDVRVRVLTGR